MSKCSVHIDHKPLAYVFKKSCAHSNLARWIRELQNYVTTESIKGEQNKVADALFRINKDAPPISSQSSLQDIIEFPRYLMASATDNLSIIHFTLRTKSR